MSPLARGNGVADISVRTMTEDDEDIGSDHKMIEIEWGFQSSKETSQKFTGWNIDGMQEEDLKQAKEWWKRWSGERRTLSDESTIEELEEEATVIRETLTEVLNQKAKKTRICARSKRWWNQDIAETRRILGYIKRLFKKRETNHASVKEARKVVKKAINSSKKDTWNTFVQ
jgi:hypothetical protein